jgi:polyhydroxybutyrate depolymerase
MHPQAGWTQWNEGAMFPNGPDDVGFIDALIDELESGYHINPSKIYATGFSLGGIMSYYLGEQMSDRLAAIASVAGQHIANPTAPRPLPVLHMHGTADSIVPIGGGFANVPPPLNSFMLPAIADVIDAWRESNQCVDEPVVTQLPNSNTQDNSTVELTHCQNCEGYSTSSGDDRSTEVMYYRILGGGHTWPGGATIGSLVVNRDINASDEIWEFFSRHELPVVMPELKGDFNRNGTVDAADYVVWRKGLGTDFIQDDYDVWRANFGPTAGASVDLPSAEQMQGGVPEPPTMLICFLAMLLMRFRCSVTP